MRALPEAIALLLAAPMLVRIGMVLAVRLERRRRMPRTFSASEANDDLVVRRSRGLRRTLQGPRDHLRRQRTEP